MIILLGLQNALWTLQCGMAAILGLVKWQSAVVCQDDRAMLSSSPKQPIVHVRPLLGPPDQVESTLILKICVLYWQIDYLQYITKEERLERTLFTTEAIYCLKHRKCLNVLWITLRFLQCLLKLCLWLCKDPSGTKRRAAQRKIVRLHRIGPRRS